jgi:predicted GIY-YIG superfamily endonuclease
MVGIIMNGENTSTNISKNTSYTVYIHKFPNGKVYIGITGQKPDRRWRNGEGYKNKQKLVYRAINKYGWDNIEHKIVATGLTKDEADCMEIALISKYKRQNRSYNITDGGDGSL